MELTTKHIGSYGGKPATIIQLRVSNAGFTITTDVTNLHGNVDTDFIINLRQIADELEEQNNKIANQ